MKDKQPVTRANEPVIRVDAFKKAYQNEIAVDGLSFTLESGQVLGMIGPNGAGKTTTLRAIAGILPSSAGSIAVSGFDVDDHPLDVKKITAYVPDDPQLFNDLTVEQHFAFTASVYEVPGWQSSMEEILIRFDLTTKRKKRASELSRGMRQKLAIGCAYLFNPQALLLDEPMTGLDPKGIRVLKKTIEERAKRGDAIIISSHLLAMVEDICTHVMILELGQKKFFGSIEELKQQFASESGDEAGSLEDFFFNAVQHN